MDNSTCLQIDRLLILIRMEGVLGKRKAIAGGEIELRSSPFIILSISSIWRDIDTKKIQKTKK